MICVVYRRKYICVLFCVFYRVWGIGVLVHMVDVRYLELDRIGSALDCVRQLMVWKTRPDCAKFTLIRGGN